MDSQDDSLHCLEGQAVDLATRVVETEKNCIWSRPLHCPRRSDLGERAMMTSSGVAQTQRWWDALETMMVC
jgi:hypothetical protein